MTELKRTDRLVTGDRMVCPTDGVVERVTFNRPGPKGRRIVRTIRHDHVRYGDLFVAVVSRQEVVGS